MNLEEKYIKIVKKLYRKGVLDVFLLIDGNKVTGPVTFNCKEGEVMKNTNINNCIIMEEKIGGTE